MMIKSIADYQYDERLKNHEFAERFGMTSDNVIKIKAKGVKVACDDKHHVISIKENYTYVVVS